MYTFFYLDIHSVEISEETLSCLSEYRKQKLSCYKKEEDRKRCTAAGLLLWEHVYFHSPENYRILAAPHQKPLICSQADGSHSHFNLSHSKDLVMLTVSSDEVGCDIQHHLPRLQQADRLDSLARRAFHPEEYRLFSSASPDARNRIFYDLWTAKEAFLKAIGTGFSADSRIYDLSCGEIYADGRHFLIEHPVLDQYPQYTAAVCHTKEHCL